MEIDEDLDLMPSMPIDNSSLSSSTPTGTTSTSAGTTSASAGTTSASAGTTSASAGTTSASAGTTSASAGTTSASAGTASMSAGTTDVSANPVSMSPNSTGDAPRPIVTRNIKENITSYRLPVNIIYSNASSTASSTPEKLPIIVAVDEASDPVTSTTLHGSAELNPVSPPSPPVQKLARVNCPEKLVICIDISSEMYERRYRAKAGTAFSGMEIIKKALKLFISNKQVICEPTRKHSFALVLLLDEALWLVDFTSDIQQLFAQIDNIDSLQEHGTEFNMSTLFDTILEKAKPPLISIDENTAPPYIVRVIFIYGRSHCLPIFKTHESQNLLAGSPCFFLDILYFHEPPTDHNLSEDIFQELCYLDTRGLSFIYDFPKTPTKVFDAFAQLLGHPLQRPIQSQTGYILEPLPSRFDGVDAI